MLHSDKAMSSRLVVNLHQCPLFADLEQAEVARMLAALPYGVHEYAAGEVVMLRGDSYESLRILLSGSVTAEMQSIAGKTMRMETLQAPELLASAVLFATRNRSPVTVTATSKSEVISFSRETVLELCRRYRPVLKALLSDVGNRLVFLAERMRLSQFTSIRQKLAIHLLERCYEQGGEEPADGSVVRLSGNRRQMAELFGVTRPALSRVLSELVDDEVIATGDHDAITLLDCERLEELASEWD